MKRIGDLAVQVDRWPVDDRPKTQHLLSVIVVGHFDDKPDTHAICKALADAATILREGKR